MESISIRAMLGVRKARQISQKSKLKKSGRSWIIRHELKAYLKRVSVYARATKPYTDAAALIEQAEYYTHYDELEEKYNQLCASNASV